MNAIYQSLIMTAEVNSLRPWEYSEWLLTEQESWKRKVNGAKAYDINIELF